MRRNHHLLAAAVLAAASFAVVPAAAAPKDRQPPSAPTDVRVAAVTATAVTLSWSAAADNVRVRGYGLYRDGARVAATGALTYTFSALACGRSYLLGVDAYDRAGNRSQVVRLTVATGACAPSTGDDPLVARSRARLREFTDWLARFGARGLVGELGWPGNPSAAGDERWNAVARAVYGDAGRAGVTVTAWAGSEVWSPSYKLLAYAADPRYAPVRVALPQAAVIESQTVAQLRGVNLAQAEFGEWGAGHDPVAATSPLHNRNVGTYGSTYAYPSARSYAYLAGRGVGVVRLPFRWERVQRTPAGDLDATELARLRESLDGAAAAGVRVILDAHNYGAYYLFDGTAGRRRPIGSAQLPESAFADLWGRVATALRGHPAVFGWGLMNEPALMSGAAAWVSASRAAVRAIRATGDTSPIFVASYDWGGTWGFPAYHAGGPWIDDPARAIWYEAHLYFDEDRSARYLRSYDEEVALAREQGW